MKKYEIFLLVIGIFLLEIPIMFLALKVPSPPGYTISIILGLICLGFVAFRLTFKKTKA